MKRATGTAVRCGILDGLRRFEMTTMNDGLIHHVEHSEGRYVLFRDLERLGIANGQREDIPLHEVGALSEKTIEAWRVWAKRKCGDGGTYGPARLKTLDDIFDSAKVGMGVVRSSRGAYRKTMAKELREMADQLERETD